MMRRFTAVIVFMFALGAPSVVHADTDEERISRSTVMWKEGMARYNIQKYDEAIDYFKKAYEINPNPDILYNLAQAYRMKKEYDTAIFYFRAFLREKPNTSKRKKVEAIIVELEKLSAAQKASEDKPPQGVEPPDGDGQVKDDADGDPAQDKTPEKGAKIPSPGVTPKKVAQVGGDAPDDRGVGGMLPSGSDRSELPRHWYEDKWGWTATGVGAIALGVGVGYLIAAEQTRGEVSDALTAFDRDRLREKADTQQAIGLPVAIAGGAVLAVGVGLLVWNPGSTSPRPAVAAGRGVAWIGIEGSF